MGQHEREKFISNPKNVYTKNFNRKISLNFLVPLIKSSVLVKVIKILFQNEKISNGLNPSDFIINSRFRFIKNSLISAFVVSKSFISKIYSP